MHIWTHLKPEFVGKTGVGIYVDGMMEHDEQVGRILNEIDELGIEDNTIVMYSTDNGAEPWTWPDGGNTLFRGAKGNNWKGGHRVPLAVKWPGTIRPDTIYNDIISHMDWMPTFSAAGEPKLVERMKKGYTVNDKKWRVHLDGYNFKPYFEGKVEAGPRYSYLYWSMTGTLSAVGNSDFKAHFQYQEGNMNPLNGSRYVKGVSPLIFNLRSEPYERATDSGAYEEFLMDQLWLFVPIQQKVGEFMSTIPHYPMQTGSSLSADVDYKMAIQLQQ